MIISCSNYILSFNDNFYIPSSLNNANNIKDKIRKLPNGFILGGKIKYNDSYKLIYLTKYNDILLSSDNNIYNINTLDIINHINILIFNKTSVYMNLSLLKSSDTKYNIILNWINIYTVEIIILSHNNTYGKLIIDGNTKKLLIISTQGLTNEDYIINIKLKKNKCNISYGIEDKQFIIQIETQKGFRPYFFPITQLYIEESSHKVLNSSGNLQKRGLLVTNLVNSFTTAKDIEKQNILKQIVSLVSKHQTDTTKRMVGLEALRNIYRNGSIDLINNLWKECKNSFDIQPYNIIDINELQMDIELGNGTFGCVKKAIWFSPEGDKNVAVKIIQENSQMFDLSDLRGEFVALSLLEHDNIIKMHGGGYIEKDIGIHNSIHWFIVMDLMEGNLAQIIHDKSFKTLCFDDKLRIAYQISIGLHHLHKHKIIHRDIKPENILIADLGISKPATDTILRTAIGTHDYMAPEICNTVTGRAEFGKEIDIYSFGILLWELFTGMKAADFHTNKKQSIFRSSFHIKFPNDLPNWICKIIILCTSINPQKRPSTNELIDAFSIQSTTEDKKLRTSSESLFKIPVKRKVSVLNTTETLKQTYSIWYYTKNLRKLIPFSEEESKILESNYIKYQQNNSLKIQTKDPLSSKILDIDYNSLYLKDSKKNKVKYHLRRKRISNNDNITKTIIVYCTGKDENNNLNFIVKGYPHEDCCDVLISVAYSYRERNIIKRTVLYSVPYQCNIPINSNEWVNILLEFDDYRPKSVDFPLLFSNELLRKTFDLSNNVFMPLYITVSFPEYANDNNLSEINNNVKQLMKERNIEILNTILTLDKNIKIDTYHNCNIYFGYPGHSYYLWKCASSNLFDKDISNKCIKQAKKYLLKSLEYLGNDYSYISFYNSCSGIYALLSTILFYEQKYKQVSDNINKLLEFSNEMTITVMFEKDVLYGFAGYMISLLFIIKHIPQEYYDTIKMKNVLHKCFQHLMDDNNPLVSFSFRNFEYFGAAHGLAGILFVLLHINDLINDEKYNKKIKDSLDYLIEQRDSNGNFKTSVQSLKSVKYHWCHGSPGIILTLLQAYKVFKDDKYLLIAEQSAELVYTQGLVRKGFNLCHGICGNAYIFLHLYQITNNNKYLYYALNFCSTISNPKVAIGIRSFKDPSRHNIGISDHPYSLMEGISGEGCLCIDIINPKDASFPGYFNDIESINILK